MELPENQSDACNKEPTVWPQWILDAGKDMSASLGEMDLARCRFREATKTDYSCRYVMQSSVNAVSDRLIADGSLDPKTGKISGQGNISRQEAITVLYQHASAYRILGQLCYAKQAVLTHLLDAVRSDLLCGNLIGTLTNFRSVIEHIAHFDAIIRKLQPHPLPSDVIEANNTLQAINATLVKMAFGTRTDWDGLFTEKIEELLIKKKTKYQPEPNRVDRQADSILDAVDGLTKKIKGVRSVYEILCEFAHPNVGILFGLTKDSQHYVDEQGVHWGAKELSLGAPIAAAKAMGDVWNATFKKIAQCLAHFDGLIIEAKAQRGKIQQISQVLFRRVLAEDRDLLSPYAYCPCESGQKVKFCCGKPTK